MRYLSLTATEDIWEAIRALRVRGAPAIGVAAAFGAYLAAYYAPDAELEGRFLAACDYLATSRPTAVNLFWALDRMRAAYGRIKALPPADIRAALRAEAQAVMDEDIEISLSLIHIFRLSAFVTTCRVPLPEAVPELRVSLSVPAEAGAV